MFAKRIISSVLKLIGCMLVIFGGAACALGILSTGAVELLFGWRNSIATLAAGVLCWVVAYFVQRWPTTPGPECDGPAACPMCGEPLDPNAGICPNCFELRSPSTRL